MGSHLICGENSIKELHASASSVGCPSMNRSSCSYKNSSSFISGRKPWHPAELGTCRESQVEVGNFLRVKKQDPSHPCFTSISCWLRHLFCLSDFVNPIFWALNSNPTLNGNYEFQHKARALNVINLHTQQKLMPIVKLAKKQMQCVLWEYKSQVFPCYYWF